MKLTDNDMRVLQVMRNVLHPSRGGNGDFDGFMPHGSRDWIAIRRLLRDYYVEQLNEYATCQTCKEPHEDASVAIAGYVDYLHEHRRHYGYPDAYDLVAVCVETAERVTARGQL